MNQMIGRIDGADTWMIMSLIIFGVFFLGVLVKLFVLKKSRIDHLKNIPFSDNNNELIS